MNIAFSIKATVISTSMHLYFLNNVLNKAYRIHIKFFHCFHYSKRHSVCLNSCHCLIKWFSSNRRYRAWNIHFCYRLGLKNYSINMPESLSGRFGPIPFRPITISAHFWVGRNGRTFRPTFWNSNVFMYS